MSSMFTVAEEELARSCSRALVTGSWMCGGGLGLG